MGVKDFRLTDDGMCFGCGQYNPIGLKLEFQNRDGEYVAEFTPARTHQGWREVTHGGILAAADEAMGRLAWQSGYNAVTAEMSIRFRQPAPTGKPLVVAGYITSATHKTLNCGAEIRNADGAVVAEATARMVVIT